jgi:hypothetical protein
MPDKSRTERNLKRLVGSNLARCATQSGFRVSPLSQMRESVRKRIDLYGMRQYVRNA